MLFTEEEIKLEEFKKYNKIEREKDKGEAKKNVSKELIKKFIETIPNYDSTYYQKNKKKSNQLSKEYYRKHREETLRKLADEYKIKKQSKLKIAGKIVMRHIQILPTLVLA